MVTTIAGLDDAYGGPETGTTYCYGLGAKGWFTGQRGGAGGAATLLRTCQNVSQTELTGVLLIAGGGGGGQAATVGNGLSGDTGGLAASSAGQSKSASGSGNLSGGNGKGGDAPGAAAWDGHDGVGGKGGTTAWGATGWTRGNPLVIGNAGKGGGSTDNGDAGSGGGGWGGGASQTLRRAGAGGSYAAAGLAEATQVDAHRGEGSLSFKFTP